MQVIDTVARMQKLRQALTGPVGFVPTMGYLHEGHLTLVRNARKENRTVIVSIFVNPTQFGPQEDFDRYPRDYQRDLTMLEKERTDIVFMPSVADMYSPQFSTWVEVTRVTERLEGAVRPGHFRGVATVVAKLFNIAQPTSAYFGQKDAQQLLVIKKMVAELNMPLEVIAVPTVREPDGLAMSSRNTYLNPQERQAATVLYKSLSLAQKLLSQGEKDAGKVRQQMKSLIDREPLANIDYISIANTETLAELEQITP
ncbi:MAG: pantoate--beta-alanine ligase, partial [Dehalococcoidales bacterium]|nr:pantoate--beta-alanine ligase [Dehalococcoidales bacterium]